VARAREVPGFDCDEPLELTAGRVVGVRAEEVFEHSSGVLDLEDPERVHNMRVATRRLRAALEIFEGCLPPKRRRRALKQVKALADALGERRDRDVQIELLEGLAPPATDSEDKQALGRLIEELQDERRLANDALADFVTEERLERLRRCLADLVRVAGR
jgi:CHAD domain-containing protein